MPGDHGTELHVSELCDQFADEIRRGSMITVDEFVASHPSCAHLLRPALTAVCSMLALRAPGGTQPGLPVPGDVLGDFKIVCMLSRGGMGVIYKAIQLSLSRVVALKVLVQLADDAQRDSTLLVRFNNEMRAAASLRHARIVPVYAVGHSDGWHFFAMQLIEGMDWQSWNRQMATDASRDWHIIARAVHDVALGLQHAHEYGVLHRDIKPSNLLRDTQGEVWIVDFGLASYPTAATVTATGDMVGTLRYLSPELLQPGRVNNDPRCDIYSLGASFYEMLTGKPLIIGERKSDQLAQLINPSYPPPRQIVRDLPLSLETIVLKMISRDPQDRYQTAADVAQDLNCWLEDKPIRAKRLSLLQRSLRWSRAHTGLMLASIVGMSLIVMLLAFLSTQLLTVRNTLRQQLLVSHVAEAQARTTSGRPGQRFAALASLSQATATGELHSAPKALQHQLKQTAATALSLVDAWPTWQMERVLGGSLDCVVFSRDLRHCTRADGDRLEVLSVADGQSVGQIVMDTGPLTVCLSGLWLVALRGPESAPTLELWNWTNGQRQWTLPSTRLPAIPQRFAIDVSSEDETIAVGLANGEVIVVDSATGQTIESLQADRRQPIGQVQFAPDGKSLATIHMAPDNAITVWNLDSRQMAAQWDVPEDAFSVGWSPDSSRLAVGSGFDVYVYDAQRWYQAPRAVLTGPQEVIANIFFHPSNRWLVVYGYDGKTRLWDIEAQEVRLLLEGHAHRFSPSGNELAYRTYDAVGLWRLGLDDVVWHQRDQAIQSKRLDICTFANDDQWLIVAGNQGLEVWDVANRSRLLTVTDVSISDIEWLPVVDELLVASEQGLWVVPLRNFQDVIKSSGPVSPTLAATSVAFADALQPSQLELPDNQQPLSAAATQSGQQIAVTTQAGGLLMTSERAQWSWLAEPGSHKTYVSMSSDGTFAASSGKNHPSTTVWSLLPQPVAWEIDTPEGGAVDIGQLDGQWHVMTSEPHRYRWWRLHADKPPELVFDVPRPSGYQKSAMAYGSEPLSAVALDNTSTRLVDPRSGMTLLDLIDGYQTDRTQDLRFDSNCRLLALALGHQGFLVWDLERLQQEFEKIGLTLDPK